MGAAPSTPGGPRLGRASGSQPEEIELMTSAEGVKLDHMRTLRDTYFSEDVSPRFRLSPDGGHIVDAEEQGSPSKQGLSPRFRRARSRGLPELLSNSPRNSLVRALSSSLSKEGSWQLVPDSTETSKLGRQLSRKVSSDRPAMPRPSRVQNAQRAASRASSDAFVAAAAFNGIDIQPAESDSPQSPLAEEIQHANVNASPFASAPLRTAVSEAELLLQTDLSSDLRPADAEQTAESPQPLPGSTIAPKLSSRRSTDSSDMPAPATPPRGSPSPVPRPFPSNEDTASPMQQAPSLSTQHEMAAALGITPLSAIPPASPAAESAPHPPSPFSTPTQPHSHSADRTPSPPPAFLTSRAQFTSSDLAQQPSLALSLERFSSTHPEVPAQQQQRLQPIQSFAGQQEAAFESGLRQLSEPVAPSISAAEVSFYTGFLNSRLVGSSSSPPLPAGCSRDQLTHACQDGILLSKLLNACVPESIDERALNVPQQPGNALGEKAATENGMLCLNAAKALGCPLNAVTAEDLAAGETSAVLECLWQIIKLGLLQEVNVKQHPQLVVVRAPDEAAETLLSSPPEALLLRWAAWHLSQPAALSLSGAQQLQPPQDFGDCLQDGRILAVLLHTLAPEAMQQPHLQDSPAVRWQSIAEALKQLQGDRVLPAKQLLQTGNPRMLLATLAWLFSCRPGLELVGKAAQEQLAGFVAWLEEYDIEASREERTFSVWLSSLLDRPLRRGVCESLKDGRVLLKVLDRLSPGCVDWRRTRRGPSRPLLKRVHSIETCNRVVTIARDLLGVPLVNIGGTDIVDGQHKLVLAILWQLMRAHMRRLLQEVSSRGSDITDAELDAEVLTWANSKVAASGRSSIIRSFHDPSIAKGQFLADLLAAVQPGIVNFALIRPGDTEEEREMNAKYCVSIARKLGCFLFLVWEDIVEVNTRMVLVLIASIMALAVTTEAPQSCRSLEGDAEQLAIADS